MRNTIKQLKKSARVVHLDTKERFTMRSNVLRAMKEYPAQVPATGHKYTSILSPYVLMRKMRNLKTMPILIVAGVLAGGTVSFAAEYTVPGDVLYPVKVHMNEAVRGAVATTPKAKAVWDVELVGRRLEEVEKLEDKPNVPEGVKEVAREHVAEYTDRAKRHIAQFEQDEEMEDALFVATKFSETLRGHEAVLDDLVHYDSDASDEGSGDEMFDGEATTTVKVATSTGVMAAEKRIDKRSLKNILKEVRQARDSTESKVMELEQKRDMVKEKEKKTKDGQGRDDKNKSGDESKEGGRSSVSDTKEERNFAEESNIFLVSPRDVERKDKVKKEGQTDKSQRGSGEEIRSASDIVVPSTTPAASFKDDFGEEGSRSLRKEYSDD